MKFSILGLLFATVAVIATPVAEQESSDIAVASPNEAADIGGKATENDRCILGTCSATFCWPPCQKGPHRRDFDETLEDYGGLGESAGKPKPKCIPNNCGAPICWPPCKKPPVRRATYQDAEEMFNLGVSSVTGLILDRDPEPSGRKCIYGKCVSNRCIPPCVRPVALRADEHENFMLGVRSVTNFHFRNEDLDVLET